MMLVDWGSKTSIVDIRSRIDGCWKSLSKNHNYNFTYTSSNFKQSNYNSSIDSSDIRQEN
jgi:hypothetical protein